MSKIKVLFTHSLTHLPIHSLTHPLVHPSTHPPTHPSTHSLTHSSTLHPPTHSLIHLPTQPLTHPLNHSFTHLLTHFLSSLPGIPDETRQEPHVRLRKVIRNSAKIFKHAKKYLVGDDSKDKVEIGHDFDGDDVRTIYYSKSEKTELDVLFTTLRQFLEEGYNEKDIAVLFLKNDKIPSEDKLSAKLNGLSWRPAKDNDSENIVISSVLKYSGLERPVVVLVNVLRPLSNFHKFPFIYGAVTRAMVKLVIIRCKEG